MYRGEIFFSCPRTSFQSIKSFFFCRWTSFQLIRIIFPLSFHFPLIDLNHTYMYQMERFISCRRTSFWLVHIIFPLYRIIFRFSFMLIYMYTCIEEKYSYLVLEHLYQNGKEGKAFFIEITFFGLKWSFFSPIDYLSTADYILREPMVTDLKRIWTCCIIPNNNVVAG